MSFFSVHGFIKTHFLGVGCYNLFRRLSLGGSQAAAALLLGGSLVLFNMVNEADTSCEYEFEYDKRDTRQNLQSLVPSTEVSSLNLKTCANSERLQSGGHISRGSTSAQV